MMTVNTRQSLVYGFLCVLILSGVYLFFYDGLWVSNDEVYLLDSTESFARHGTLDRTYTYNLIPELNPDNTVDFSPRQEPLQPVLAAPLYWLGLQFPDIGMVHTVWLFNILVTICTALLLYSSGLLLDYRPAVSLQVALLYGLATLAFPYSTTFFREPLMGFFVTGCFISIWYWRQQLNSGQMSWRALLLFVISFIGALLTKSIILVLLPVLLIVGIPHKSKIRTLFKNRQFKLSAGFLVLILFTAVIALFTLDTGLAEYRYSFSFISNQFQNADAEYILESMAGYQISPGRSIWLYSPVLLLVFPGILLSWKQKREWQFPLAVIISILIFSLSYAVVQGVLWWGGNGWGPRYMVPLIPVSMLLLFPVIEWLYARQKITIWHGAVLLLTLTGIAVQIIGSGYPVNQYYSVLSVNGILPWEDGIWTWEWSPIRQHLLLWDFNNIDIASEQVPLVDASLFMGSIILLFVLLLAAIVGHRWPVRSVFYPVMGLVISISILIAAFALRIHSVQDDPRYVTYPELMPLIENLDQAARDDDVIFIENQDFFPAFINYFKTSARVITLPYAPGERYSPGVEPEILTDDVVQQVRPQVARMMFNEMAVHDRAWLVITYSHLDYHTIRPSERLLVDHYFPVEEIRASERSVRPRAIRFATIPARQSFEDYSINASFARNTPVDGLALWLQKIRLLEMDLPAGNRYHAGEIVPVTLVWQSISPLPENYNLSHYNLSVQIAHIETGIPIVNRDGIPRGEFGYMSRWLPGNIYLDNHGLQLPLNIPAGTYTLQIIVYNWMTGERLQIFDAAGRPVGDWLRPTEITITG